MKKRINHNRQRPRILPVKKRIKHKWQHPRILPVHLCLVCEIGKDGKGKAQETLDDDFFLEGVSLIIDLRAFTVDEAVEFFNSESMIFSGCTCMFQKTNKALPMYSEPYASKKPEADMLFRKGLPIRVEMSGKPGTLSGLKLSGQIRKHGIPFAKTKI